MRYARKLIWLREDQKGCFLYLRDVSGVSSCELMRRMFDLCMNEGTLNELLPLASGCIRLEGE